MNSFKETWFSFRFRLFSDELHALFRVMWSGKWVCYIKKFKILQRFDYVYHGINYFADLRMTFRQNFFLQDWFRNKFGVGLD
jgi:hypothetical protein